MNLGDETTFSFNARRIAVRACIVLAVICAVALGIFGLTDNMPRRRITAWRIRIHAQRLHEDSSEKDALKYLLDCVNGNYEFCSVYAISTLGDTRGHADAVVPVLVKSLNSTNPYAAREAALSLGRIGPEAYGAVPALQSIVMSGDPGRDVTWFAATSLGQIGKAACGTLPALKSKLGVGPFQFDVSLREAIGQLEAIGCVE